MTSFYILWNTKSEFFYMKPDIPMFYVYTKPELYQEEIKDVILKRVQLEANELQTLLFNAGFLSGYFDNQAERLKRDTVLFYERNPNQLYFEQYLLTNDESWLKNIRVRKLYALCKLQGDDVLYASVTDDESEGFYILTFTNRTIPKEVLDRYPDFSVVAYPVCAPYLLNLQVPVTEVIQRKGA